MFMGQNNEADSGHFLEHVFVEHPAAQISPSQTDATH
jgi:hypothetical protein